ncbi:hypothetical protein [Actinoplanes sp. L3-i22]|uniref:hypothetical protein n=1 Tax=Actinoplanes sp. L3-i22 TaxID=2836373 RepID=UPI001C77E3A3|nr:hypothetical protein [Actinoplanes sp. L3-i22]BCY10069.1 hypothetical protein L3i22_051570 [Actinoplanes sp. L3-i22]
MKRWIWLAVSLAIVALGVTTIALGLDKADKISSVAGAIVAVIGLGLGLAGPEKPMLIRVRSSGRIVAGGTGHTNTGVDAPSSLSRHTIEVDGSGDIDSSGGGDANTGVTLR